MVALPASQTWMYVRNQSSFLHKRNVNGKTFTVFAGEKGNVMNVNAFKYSGLANEKTIAIDIGADGEVVVGGEAYTADHVLVAVGGVPSLPLELEGGEHTITSDGFFELEAMPESCLVVGAGYIAVEMAGILNALGCDTTLAVRGDKALRAFDELLSTTLDAEMKRAGMTRGSKRERNSKLQRLLSRPLSTRFG